MSDNSRLSPVTARLLEQVTWDWQPLEPLMSETAKIVPPGKAMRKYSMIQTHARERQGGAPHRPRIQTDEEKIQTGARSYVRASLNTARRANRIEVKVEGDVEYIRFKSAIPVGDRCPTCGTASGIADSPVFLSDQPPDPTLPISKRPGKSKASRSASKGATVLQFPVERIRAHG